MSAIPLSGYGQWLRCLHCHSSPTRSSSTPVGNMAASSALSSMSSTPRSRWCEMLIDLAISILWLLIGVIIILGIVWLAIYVIQLFVQIPDPVVKAIWAVVLILILIAALTLLSGRGSTPSFFRK